MQLIKTHKNQVPIEEWVGWLAVFATSGLSIDMYYPIPLPENILHTHILFRNIHDI